MIKAMYRFFYRRFRDAKYSVLDFTFYLRHGFRRSEIWSLDSALAKWLAPRLRYFADHHVGQPCGMKDGEWGAILQKMLEAFELIAAPEYYDVRKGSDPYEKKIRVGLALFPKYYRHLWD